MVVIHKRHIQKILEILGNADFQAYEGKRHTVIIHLHGSRGMEGEIRDKVTGSRFVFGYDFDKDSFDTLIHIKGKKR